MNHEDCLLSAFIVPSLDSGVPHEMLLRVVIVLFLGIIEPNNGISTKNKIIWFGMGKQMNVCAHASSRKVAKDRDRKRWSQKKPFGKQYIGIISVNTYVFTKNKCLTWR